MMVRIRSHLVTIMDKHSGSKRAYATAVCIVLALVVATWIAFEGVPIGEKRVLQGNSSHATVSPVPENSNSYVLGELIVGIDELRVSDVDVARRLEASIERLGFRKSCTLLKTPEGLDSVLLIQTDERHASGDALAEAARSVSAIPDVAFVQPNYHFASRSLNAAEVAHDPDVSSQYYLNAWDDARGANVAKAWKLVDPAVKVDVAVLDTGMYYMPEKADSKDSAFDADPANYHQEFDAGNLDMGHGVDFVHSGAGQLLPLVNELNPSGDDNGHGTHVAAVIAANAQTEKMPAALPVGMAGVSPNARIVPIKVLDSAGEGDVADFLRAYDYLLSEAASGSVENLRVINMSVSLAFDDGANDDGVRCI